MKVALCGYPPFTLRVQEGLKNSNIEPKFFIRDFVSARGGDNFTTNLPPINFFDFRRLVDAGELDGVIVAENEQGIFMKQILPLLKLYNIPNVIIINPSAPNLFNPLFALDAEKSFIPYLEANLVDGCNLNCKGCTHFAALFGKDEIYPLETFRRDVRRLSQLADVYRFRLLGGEPLLLKNLDEYLRIARTYLPKTWMSLVTNGLLIPSLPKKILDAIRENNFVVDISGYPPTMKIFDKINEVLTSNGIRFLHTGAIKNFNVFLSSHSGNDPLKSRSICFDDVCRFLRDGKIYKCPIDALKYRLVEKFGVKNYPRATGIDIYAQNFSSLIQMLDGNVEMCYWCSERSRQIPWTPTNNPRFEDWLADPDELKNFCFQIKNPSASVGGFFYLQSARRLIKFLRVPKIFSER